jgi:hypothetical protein
MAMGQQKDRQGDLMVSFSEMPRSPGHVFYERLQSVLIEGDTTTLAKTLASAEENLASVDAAPTAEDPTDCVADKEYHSRAVLKALDDSPWTTRIAEPKQKGFSRWHGDAAARRAVTNNRTRLLSEVARQALCSRGGSRAAVPTAMMWSRPTVRSARPNMASAGSTPSRPPSSSVSSNPSPTA